MFKTCTSKIQPLIIINNFDLFVVKSLYSTMTTVAAAPQIITEGRAKITTPGHVFYNPVQEFNRDLSIAALSVFAKQYTSNNKSSSPNEQVVKCETTDVGTTGISILEALSASGLRSIRYAKEIPGVREIIANDISAKAVASIQQNITDNQVEHLVTSNQEDAASLMYRHSKTNKFDAIDLDPYGCPAIFLDAAVQAVKDGGLLLVTATDMAVLAGNSPETCYRKYGAVSLRIKSCHEMALRILLQCIESHANRYGRYIVPLLSLSADFYIRVIVKVFSDAKKCKETTSKLSTVYHCTGCGTFVLHPLGVLKSNEKNPQQIKYGLATGPPVGNRCEHCASPYHIGGPIWSAPIQSPAFVQEILDNIPPHLGTARRIQGVLTVITEELLDAPLYYKIDMLSGTLHVEMPSMINLRSAFLNAGYNVSCTHMHKMGLKTNAPAQFVWDMMRCWSIEHPISEKRLRVNSPGTIILATKPTERCSFELHPDANPLSRKKGFLRFQQNPTPFWGPGTRATAMVGEQKVDKSKRNQGKRKREQSEEHKVDLLGSNTIDSVIIK